MSDSIPPSNGTPLISPKIVPWLTALVTLATAGAATFPPHTIAFKVSLALSSLGGIFGIVSPGWRR